MFYRRGDYVFSFIPVCKSNPLNCPVIGFRASGCKIDLVFFSPESIGNLYSCFVYCMASQAETEENYKKELEKAIEFFEIAAKESSYNNPAKFCLPFYRSFHTIIFKKQEAREEVNKYLKEAKSAIKGSESKKQLFEAVENLAEALKEVQNLGNLDLSEMKDELNFYRKYCDHENG